MHNLANVLFREVQQFRQPLFWVIVIAVFVVMIVSFGIPFLKELREQKKFGGKGINFAITMVVYVVLLVLFFQTALTVEVRTDGVYHQLFPLEWSKGRIAPQQIKSHRAIRFNPLKDFGGWGIRLGNMGKGYIVSGDRGVRIVQTNGDAIVLGSQRARALEQAISRCRGNSSTTNSKPGE